MAFTAKTDWAKGDVLPHTDMNRIEQGVKDAHTDIGKKQDSSTALKLGTTSTTAMAGNKTFSKSDVGLPNVDNTSDANKPVSTAQKTALDLKLNAADALKIGTTATTALAGNTALLKIGTTASTAAAGNHNHAVTADAASGLEAAATIQALAVALSARIEALEDRIKALENAGAA